MTWQLAEPCDGIFVVASPDGIWLRGPNINRGLDKPKTRLGRLLPTLIPQLLELDIAVIEDDSIKIPYDKFVELEDADIDAFENMTQWSPFAIEIQTMGSLGLSDFKYKIRFYWGKSQIHVDRVGCFIRWNDHFYRLDKQTFTLIESVEKFNSLSPSEKSKPDNALLSFSKIKGLSEDIGAEIDRYIADQKIIVPAKIGLDLIFDNETRLSFVPKIDDVPSEGIIKAFLANDDVDEVYSVESPEGGRIRVLLSESQREVLKRMQKVRHLGGLNKAKVLSNPFMIFDGVADSVDIDLKKFGPRVIGIGDFPFASQPFVSYGSTGIFDDIDTERDHPRRSKINAGVKFTYSDGTIENVNFTVREELLNFYNDLKAAQQMGNGTVKLKNKTIVIEEDFAKGIEDIVNRISKPRKDKTEQATGHHYLLIYTNESELEYNEDNECQKIGGQNFCIPASLRNEVSLKSHQLAGLNWLQLNYLKKRHGCLLADEMGLGKTLQVLTFLAWLIEKGDISPSGKDIEIMPWNPILIIAPVMLLENETWINDMKNFFNSEGNVFQPFITLHGSELKKFRKAGIRGRETELESSVLDLDKLRQYRVILTNYETITNYQYSFAMMKDSLSVIITDEAQEYKTPNTKISHALKSLSPKFKIACTGTPVETRLIDIWNIFDFLQPGRLGSASAFSTEYERPIAVEKNPSEILGKLRDRLYFGKPNAFVLRRDKTKLTDLPHKHEHKIFVDLSPEQSERHMDFIEKVRMGGEGCHPFSILHQLMKLYQHPMLLPQFTGLDSGSLDDACKKAPKLEKVLGLLIDIRSKGEKVLIFTRSLDMQQILTSIISAKFGITVDIINGGSNRKGTQSVSNTRRDIVRRFRNSIGFNVLILSPDVAGVGLTLTEANHVIHYGRWWNPAKEAQATDRVYRIGQKKDVHVYYPICREPNAAFKTFDERLDFLIQKRRELAADFLTPMPDESELGKELWEDLIGEKKEARIARPLTEGEVRLLPWDRFESLIALVEEKKSRESILTPRSGDYGIDVISISGNQVWLIQCKHTNWDAFVDNDVIDEMRNAFDNYRWHWLGRMSPKFVLKPLLVTNGKLTKTFVAQAKIHDIQVISGNDLWKILMTTPCSLAEIEIKESQRMASMRAVQTALKELLN